MYLCPGNGSLQRRYNNLLLYTEVISIRGSKILGDAPRIFLLHVDCVLRTLPGVLSLPPSPFANILDQLQDRTSLKQLLYTSGCALHIILPYLLDYTPPPSSRAKLLRRVFIS